MSWDGLPFAGAKLAAVLGDALLVYRRDDRPDIPFPGLLDLPGGGREGGESPAECALRELAEEFGITIPADRIHYHQHYLLGDGVTVSHFLALTLTEAEVAAVRFGDEGQDWALLPIADYIADADAVPRLRDWLSAYHAGNTVF
ncbi:MAG: hypothetical protein RL490_345 [Pseudomonadota bacterium]|jgi:8-oxo-dGTP diphosphatase